MIYVGLGDGNASRGQLLSSCTGKWIWRKDNDKVRVFDIFFILNVFVFILKFYFILLIYKRYNQ